MSPRSRFYSDLEPWREDEENNGFEGNTDWVAYRRLILDALRSIRETQKDIDERLRAIEKWQAGVIGKSVVIGAVIGVITAAVGIVVGVVADRLLKGML